MLLTIGASLFTVLFSSIIPLHFFFGLSLAGIQKGWVWQLLTYAFIQPAYSGISFSFLIHLSFDVYLLWIMGSSIVERSSPKQFIALYLSSAIAAGLLALSLMYICNALVLLAGTSALIYTLLIAWMMLHSDAIVSLFFIPIKAKWLILGLLGANLLIELSNHNWIYASLYVSASVFGYIFSIIQWKQCSPFLQLYPFEKWLMNLHFPSFFRRKKQRSSLASKIFDFKTGKPILSDEEFIDAMLAKISLEGENALTEQEKAWMQAISEKQKEKELV